MIDRVLEGLIDTITGSSTGALLLLMLLIMMSIGVISSASVRYQPEFTAAEGSGSEILVINANCEFDPDGERVGEYRSINGTARVYLLKRGDKRVAVSCNCNAGPADELSLNPMPARVSLSCLEETRP